MYCPSRENSENYKQAISKLIKLSGMKCGGRSRAGSPERELQKRKERTSKSPGGKKHEEAFCIICARHAKVHRFSLLAAAFSTVRRFPDQPFELQLQVCNVAL